MVGVTLQGAGISFGGGGGGGGGELQKYSQVLCATETGI